MSDDITHLIDAAQGDLDSMWRAARSNILHRAGILNAEPLVKRLDEFLPERIEFPQFGVTAPATPAPVLEPGHRLGEALLAKAAVHRGLPYTWGGDGKTTFDCSALTQRAARDLGESVGVPINLGRTTYDQITAGREIPWGQQEIGDLVFSRFSDTDGVWETPEHVSIWAGNGKVFEAGDPIDYYTWGNRGNGPGSEDHVTESIPPQKGLVASEIRNCRLKGCRWTLVTEWRPEHPRHGANGFKMKLETVEKIFHEHIKSHTREEQSRIFSIEEGRV